MSFCGENRTVCLFSQIRQFCAYSVYLPGLPGTPKPHVPCKLSPKPPILPVLTYLAGEPGPEHGALLPSQKPDRKGWWCLAVTVGSGRKQRAKCDCGCCQASRLKWIWKVAGEEIDVLSPAQGSSLEDGLRPGFLSTSPSSSSSSSPGAGLAN